MSVLIDPTPIVIAVIGSVGSSVAFIVRRAEKREKKHADALEHVRTDIKEEEGKRLTALSSVNQVVNDLQGGLSYLRGVKDGEDRSRPQHQN